MNTPWTLTLCAVAAFIGLRYRVGGDWENYLKNLEEAAYHGLSWNDPGYRLVEFVSLELGLGIYGVNVAGAVVFSHGLIAFCRNLPRPWLGLAVAVPYLVIIVGMGYTRQAMAIGCAMAGLVYLGRGRAMPFLAWVLIATTLHKSAVLLLPIAALAATERRLWMCIWVVVITFLAYTVALEDAVEALQANYLDAEYQSEGALVRLLMNAVPAALFLATRRRFDFSRPQRVLWSWFAVISFVLLGLYFVSPSSTAVDRVALYLLPLQMVVFAALPEAVGGRAARNEGVIVAILVYFATVQGVWLHFANNAMYWLPYRFAPLEALN